MQNSDISALCERRFLQLIEDYGLPDPDAIEHDEGRVRFYWREPKLVVQIDLDDFCERDANGGYRSDDIAA